MIESPAYHVVKSHVLLERKPGISRKPIITWQKAQYHVVEPTGLHQQPNGILN